MCLGSPSPYSRGFLADTAFAHPAFSHLDRSAHSACFPCVKCSAGLLEGPTSRGSSPDSASPFPYGVNLGSPDVLSLFEALRMIVGEYHASTGCHSQAQSRPSGTVTLRGAPFLFSSQVTVMCTAGGDPVPYCYYALTCSMANSLLWCGPDACILSPSSDSAVSQLMSTPARSPPTVT